MIGHLAEDEDLSTSPDWPPEHPRRVSLITALSAAALGLILAIVFASALKSYGASRCPNADDLSRAALQNLWADYPTAASATGRIAETAFSVWNHRIEALSAWAQKIPDVCVRQAYLDWAGFYAAKLDEAETQSAVNASRGHWDIREEEFDEQMRHAKLLAKDLPKPPAMP